ncbi:hypothetical protein [Cecembia rubra]|uniref:Uncharacterized protein n=1 Tax=Cecembia rubra TaxID=1485585 RepID=A0A2P8ECB2_9BACT|nr:hypothetical protein [Cecembia rubra]PSL07091.1 hypothetical protein CLV48_10118 [Cecembia rubra]
MNALRNYLVLLLIFLVFSSCEKDNRPDFYYRFKFEGVQREFKATSEADIIFIDTPSGLKLATFTMVSGKDTKKNSMVIGLRYTGDLERTYEMQNPIMVNGVLAPTLTFVYYDENGRAYLASLLQSENLGARDDGKLTFTDLTVEGAYGTFEAIVFDPLESTSELSARKAFKITDGEFFLPMVASIRTE